MRTGPDDGVALVTGASAGIGRAVAERLAAEGIPVVNIDRRPAPPLEGCVHVEADLADPASTAAALAAIVERFPVTRLVNNAGIVIPAGLEETRDEDLALSLRVNLEAALWCARALVRGMRERGFGRIVNVASRAAYGKEERSAYAASKAGLIGLTRTWALEYAAHGITVNAVAPGPVATELFRRGNPEGSERTRRIVGGVPVGRMGEPEDVANAVMFFLDRRSSFVTGQVLPVCGGLTVGLSPA